MRPRKRISGFCSTAGERSGVWAGLTSGSTSDCVTARDYSLVLRDGNRRAGIYTPTRPSPLLRVCLEVVGALPVLVDVETFTFGLDGRTQPNRLVDHVEQDQRQAA